MIFKVDHCMKCGSMEPTICGYCHRCSSEAWHDNTTFRPPGVWPYKLPDSAPAKSFEELERSAKQLGKQNEQLLNQRLQRLEGRLAVEGEHKMSMHEIKNHSDSKWDRFFDSVWISSMTTLVVILLIAQLGGVE